MCSQCPTELTEEFIGGYRHATSSFADERDLTNFLSNYLGMFSVNNVVPRIMRQRAPRSSIPDGVVARVLYAHGHSQLAELCDLAETILLIEDGQPCQNPCGEIPLPWDGGNRSPQQYVAPSPKTTRYRRAT